LVNFVSLIVFSRDGSMPNIKQNGIKLPSLGKNIMYSPNLANLNNAKINKSKVS
jgi:hypothetical protein